MVWIDYAIMAVLGLSCLVSLIRGFVREALSLVTWGCAFYVASHYYADLSVWFTGFEDERVRNGIAIAALFIVTLIVGAIVNYVIGQLFPTPVIVAAATLLLFWLFTRKTALGMFIEAVGINIRAAKNAGVNTRIVVMLAYVLSGVCAAIAGIIVAADIRGADANNAGLWLELDAILAVVIGGASLMGGRFNLLLSVVGALIIQGMNTGILLSGFPPELNQVVKAVVVLCVLIVQSPRFIGLLKGVRGHDKT